MLTFKEPNEDVYLWLKRYRGEWLDVSSAAFHSLLDERGSVEAQHRYTQMHPPEFMTYDRSMDQINYRSMWAMMLRELVPYSSRNETALAMELGCSADVSMYRFVAPHFFGKYVGLDVHPESAAHAKSSTSLDVICASYHQIPLADDSVNLLIEANAYDMTRCLVQALREAYRVLRPGGTFIAFQDVIPNAIATLGCTRAAEAKKAYFRDGIDQDAQGLRNPVLLFVDGEMLDVRSYHIAKVREAGASAGFGIIQEGILEASDAVEASGRIHQRFTRVDHRCAKYIYLPDSKIISGTRMVLTQANILVMQKPSA